MTGWVRGLQDRRELQAHVRAAAAASVRPPRDERSLHLGSDPVHVLLIGSGVAVGYGAASRAEALDGRLGARLAELLGRGVVVVNEAADGARLDDQVLRAAVGLVFPASHLLVWCPSYVEMASRRGASAWERQMRRLLELREGSPMVVLELPRPVGEERAAATAGPVTDRINHRLRRAAAGFPNVEVVAVPVVHVERIGRPLFGPDYYDRLGADVAVVAARLLAAARGARRTLEPSS